MYSQVNITKDRMNKIAVSLVHASVVCWCRLTQRAPTKALNRECNPKKHRDPISDWRCIEYLFGSLI